jgi:WD40 repeat protein
VILLQGAREQIDVLQFSPDGRTLVAPCRNRVQVWHDLAAGRQPATLCKHRSVRTLRFTPCGQKLLLVGTPGGVHDLLSGETVTFPHPWQVLFACLTPDGQHLASTEAKGGLPKALWRLCCRPLADLTSSVWQIEVRQSTYTPPLFLAGGERFLVFEGEFNSIPFWYVTRDARTGQVLSEVKGTGHQFLRPVLSADRRLVAARCGVRAAVFQTNNMGAEPVILRNDNRKEFTGLAFHPSGRFLAATSNDATIKFYDTSTWKVARSFDWDIGRLRSVAFSPDGMLAAAGGDKGKIVVWDVDL